MRYEDISKGTALPQLDYPITASSIVAAALATNDYEDVHHDIAAAQSKGMPNIFQNILTTNGLVQRYVNDWAGPSARIKKVQIRLGAPNFPGDTMKLTGEAEPLDGTREVNVKVSGRNSIGEHVTATVTLEFPEAAR